MSKEVESSWSGLNYYEKLNLLAQLGLPASDAWLDWANLSDDAKETITKALSQPSPLNRTLVERHGPVELWEDMDTKKRSIISPEGEEEYSDERWDELTGKYVKGGGTMIEKHSSSPKGGSNDNFSKWWDETDAEYKRSAIKLIWGEWLVESAYELPSDEFAKKYPNEWKDLKKAWEEGEWGGGKSNPGNPTRGTGLERHSQHSLYEVCGRLKGIPASTELECVEVDANNIKEAEQKGRNILADRLGGDVVVKASKVEKEHSNPGSKSPVSAAIKEARDTAIRLAKQGKSGKIAEALHKIADKWEPKGGPTYDHLVREAIKVTGLEKFDSTARAELAPGAPVGVILSKEEKKLGKEYAQKLERCITHLKGKKGIISPIAICRSSLKKTYGLPVKSETKSEER